MTILMPDRDGADDPAELRSIMRFKLPRPINGYPYEMHIEPGIYSLDSVLQESYLPNPEPLHVQSSEIVILRSAYRKKIREQIHQFFALTESIERLGFLHKGGLMLDGPPGSGKSTIVRQEVVNCVTEGLIVFYARDPWTLSRSLRNLREMEPHRGCVAIIEDIEDVVRSFGTRDLVEMLDGAESVSNVLFIATSNDASKLPAKLTRKGRFSRRVEVPYPCFEQRFEYFNRKCKKLLSEKTINIMAKHTKGLGFGALEDVIKHYIAYRVPLLESIQLAREEMSEGK